MQNFSFKREFEGRFRAWHWLMVLCVFGLLTTALLRVTYLNSGANGKIIATKLMEQNITIDDKSAREIAKTIRDPMWQWHNYFGFGLLGVSIFGIYVRRTCKDSCPIKRAKQALEVLKETTTGNSIREIREFAIIKASHGAFFLLLLGMIVSGFVMILQDSLGLSKGFVHDIKELHEAGLWAVLLFVVAHIAGVVRKELTSEHGLISSIVGGK